MKSYTTPDGIITISWSGGLDEKIKLLADFGINYTPTPEELEEVIDIQALADEYTWAITTLGTIIASPDPTVVNLQTIVVMAQAIKDIARIERRLLKLLRRQYNGE